MGPPRYSELLRQKVDRLSPKARQVREGVAQYLENVSRGARRELVWRFRHLAKFLKFGGARWPLAADRLFAMKYQEAETTLDRYRAWIRRKKDYSCRTKFGLISFGFRRLSRTLKRNGVLKWELKHERARETVRLWMLCPPAFREEVQGWLRVQQAAFLKPETLRSHRNELQHLGRYLKERSLLFTDISYADALAWVEKQRESGLVPTGFNRRLGLVQHFYDWLKARKVVSENPFETFRPARVPRKLPRILSEAEVVKLIQASGRGRNRAILEVLYASGCRIGDLCSMDLEKVSFKERTARAVGKGGNETILYLNEPSIKAIKAYLPARKRLLETWRLEPQTALFLRRDGERLSTYAARGAVEAASRKAGFAKHVHPHMLRHSFATHMLNRGADLFSIMQFLGHKDIQSTVRYLQVATARLSEVHRRFHPRK